MNKIIGVVLICIGLTACKSTQNSSISQTDREINKVEKKDVSPTSDKGESADTKSNKVENPRGVSTRDMTKDKKMSIEKRGSMQNN